MVWIDDLVSDLELDQRNIDDLFEVGDGSLVDYLLCELRNWSLLWS